jgi:hypothetical protein
MNLTEQLENLPFGETLQISGCTVERIIIGAEAGWMIRCGKDVFNTRYIIKAVSYIEQHRQQEEITNLEKF